MMKTTSGHYYTSNNASHQEIHATNSAYFALWDLFESKLRSRVEILETRMYGSVIRPVVTHECRVLTNWAKHLLRLWESNISRRRTGLQ